MPKLKSKSIIKVQQEVNYGTDALSGAAAGQYSILVDDIEITTEVEPIERGVRRPSLSRLPHVIGTKLATVKFTTELKGMPAQPSSKVSHFETLHLFQACGCVISMNTSFNCVFLRPFSSNEPPNTVVSIEDHSDHTWGSCTIYAYQDGILHKLTGCFGNFTLTLENGQRPLISWEFTGRYENPISQSVPSLDILDYHQHNPEVCQDIKAQISNWQPNATKIEINANNEIANRPSFNDPTGFAGFYIAGRDYSGTIDPEVVSLDTHNPWSKFIVSNAEMNISCVVGTNELNKFKVKLDRCQYTGITYADRDGILTYDLPFKCRSTESGSDEFKLFVGKF